MSNQDKPLVWLHGEVKTPPFSYATRLEAGFLLRKLQTGESIELPHSRPLSVIGKNCHELRLTDKNCIWRIVYSIDKDAIVILEVFKKKSQTTPKSVIETCKQRLKNYEKN